jgi:hypothetical protein
MLLTRALQREQGAATIYQRFVSASVALRAANGALGVAGPALRRHKGAGNPSEPLCALPF